MNFKIIGILIIGFILFFNFNLTLSQTNTVSTTVSLPTLGEKEPGKLINQFYDFLLIISGLLAFAVIVYGGIERILAAGNPSKISDSNEWIKSAIIGLLLLFGAYIILKLINPNLVNLKLPELQGIKVEKPEYMKLEEGGAVTGGVEGIGGVGLSDAEARQLLTNAGIGVKSTNTTLEGIKQGVIDELIRMKKECDGWLAKYYPNESKNGCKILVTGGTEAGHASGNCSHANGYKADIDDDMPLVNEFIIKNYCKTINQNGQNICTYYYIREEDKALMYKSPTSGATYAKESNHWDIQITSQCP